MRAVLFAVLAGVCWGVGELATKSVLHSGKLGPMTVLLARAVMTLPPALIAYWVAASLLRSEPEGWWRAGSPVLAKLLLGSGLLAGFGGVLFFYLGLASGPISTVKPIAFTIGPAVAVVLAWALLGERVTAVKAVGVVMVLAGVVLIAGTGGSATPAPTSQTN
ncbi:MAG: DMT family transporter [Phycisphaerales bacterium]